MPQGICIAICRATEVGPGYIDTPFVGLLLLYEEDDFRANPASWSLGSGVVLSARHHALAETIRAGLKQGRTDGRADGFVWERLKDWQPAS